MNVITLHHLACSGGTILSKAIAAMKGVVLLSEIHPDRHLENGYDPLVQLTSGYNLDEGERRKLDECFVREIEVCAGLAKRRNCQLVIRDHCSRDFVEMDRHASRLVELLQPHIVVTPIVTVRDPVDTWISYRRRGWFNKGDPGELCSRLLRLVAAFDSAPVYKYEDFIADTDRLLSNLCEHAGIEFCKDFQARMAEVTHLTGNSGRSGELPASRPRQRIYKEEVRAFLASPQYAEVCERFGYTRLLGDEGFWNERIGRAVDRFSR